jgi:hypothetical protein
MLPSLPAVTAGWLEAYASAAKLVNFHARCRCERSEAIPIEPDVTEFASSLRSSQ